MSRSARERTLSSRCVVESLEVRRHLAADPGPARGLDDTAPPTLPGPAKSDGPTAELVPSTRTEGGEDSFVFRVIYRDADAAVRVSSLDDRDIRITGPDGVVRRAVFINADDTVDGPARVARYKFAPPGGSWDAGDNGAYRVALQADEVFDTLGAAAAAGDIGRLEVELPPGPESDPYVGLYGLDPAQFGAFPNDGIDDTAAIQAAIDALPRGPGVPIGSTPAGGIILLREGVYDTSYSLYLHSGVTLRGAGPQTVLRNRGANIYQDVIALYSPFTHGFNVGVTVDRMTIYSVNGGGIAIDPLMISGDVQDLRLADLRISTAGPAIDLSSQRVYHSEIDSVEVYNPGSTAVRLGKADGSNHVNRIRNLSVTGTARAAFRREEALVFLNADVLVQGMTIATRGANVLPLYVTNRTTLNGLRLEVPAANCPDGVAAFFDRAAYVMMDTLDGVGEQRRIMLTSSYNVDIGAMRSDGSSNLISRLAVVDATSHLRVRNAVGGRLIEPEQELNGDPGPEVLPPPTRVVDARLFGALANDGVDDTLQIQLAIDSLPAYDLGTGTGGGIVQLPLGYLNVSASIKLPSGVWLRGHGNGTTIQNLTTAGAARAVVELDGRTGNRNVGAGIVELGLRGDLCSGIRADESVWYDVDHLLVQDVRLKEGARGIDLRGVRVSNSVFDRVVMTDPGSTALWLGRIDNSSYGNVVRAFRVMGRAPVGFVRETALFVLHGNNRMESGSIEETFSTVLPIYAAGPRVTLLDVYMEYPQQPDGVGYVLDRVQDGYISNLWHVDPQRKLHLTGNSNVRVGTLNIVGYTVPLEDCIFVEGGSHATFDTVLAQFDAGMLDDTRVTVNGIYSTRARRYVDTDTALNGNMVADPGMTDVAHDRIANWTIYWGDAGGVVGNWAVETAGGKRRLRLTVLSNPNNLRVSVRIKLNVPPGAIGKEAAARWRVDGGGEVFAWRGGWDGEYQARVTNSLTAMVSPKPIAANEELWIDLRAAQGTYYLWNVGVAPVVS